MYLQNKYTSWYNSIITNAQSRSLLPNIYTERHHVIPKSIGGSDSKDNLVYLTAKEHFICHLLLPKMLAGENKYKMIYASNQMLSYSKLHQRYVPTSRIYQQIKNQFSQIHSKRMKGTTQSIESNLKRSKALTGRKTYERTPEIIAKLKETKKNNPQPAWNKGKTSKNKGKTYEEIYGVETAINLKKIRSESLKGKSKSEETKLLWSSNRKGKTTGAKNPNASPVTVDGINYGSKIEACESLNISLYKLNKMLS